MHGEKTSTGGRKNKQPHMKGVVGVYKEEERNTNKFLKPLWT